MSLLRRLRNLWLLSEYTPRYDYEVLNKTVTVRDELPIEKVEKQGSFIQLNAVEEYVKDKGTTVIKLGDVLEDEI
jgi:hypothetical protein